MKNDEIESIAVRLTADHTHAGEQKKPGDTIELTGDLADWLVGLGRAERVTTANGPPARARVKQTPTKET